MSGVSNTMTVLLAAVALSLADAGAKIASAFLRKSVYVTRYSLTIVAGLHIIGEYDK